MDATATLLSIVIVGYITLVSAGSATFCPPKWTYYQQGKTCLRSYPEKTVSYKDAEKICREETDLSRILRSDVVTITDKEMLGFVHSVVVDTGQYFSWVGPNKTGNRRGKKLKKANFKLQGKETKKQCVVLQNMKYNSVECDEKGAYPLCQLTPERIADLCLTENGGCSHRCVPYAYRKRVCACPVGLVLLKGETTCVDIKKDPCYHNNGGCDHFCEKMGPKGRVLCSCESGYALRQVTRCLDIDECTDGFNGGCQHGCVNTEGSRNCTCAIGFFALNETHCVQPLNRMMARGSPDIGAGKGKEDKTSQDPNYHQHSLIMSMYVVLCITGALIIARALKCLLKMGDKSIPEADAGPKVEEKDGLRESRGSVELNGLGGML